MARSKLPGIFFKKVELAAIWKKYLQPRGWFLELLEKPTPAALLVGASCFGLALRLHAVINMPLPPPHLFFGLILALCEDAAISAALVLIASFGRTALAAGFGCVLSLAFLQIAWSEALIYFGHPPRCADIEVGTQRVFIVRTFDIGALAVPLIFLVLMVVFILLAFRFRILQPKRITAIRFGLSAGLLGLAVSLFVPTPEYYRNPLMSIVKLWRCVVYGQTPTTLFVASPSLAKSFIRELMPQLSPKAFPLPGNDLAYFPPPRGNAPTGPTGMRPNIVFILLEGVRAHEIGAWGGQYPGLTPNLDQLASSGIRFSRAYSPGTHTSTSELALWYGALAVPDEIIMQSRPDLPLTGLPEQLRGAGWRSFLWMHGADTKIYKREQFYQPRGFRMVDERGFAANSPSTNWGVSDKTLMRGAATSFDHLAEPFGALLLTVTNHYPFQVPVDGDKLYQFTEEFQNDTMRRLGRTSGSNTLGMLQTTHYTDEAIGLFFALARTRAWFSRTLFVISGDHGLPLSPQEGIAGLHELEELRLRVPLLIYAPWLHNSRVVEDPVSLSDLPATILGLLEIEGLRQGPGVDVLAQGMVTETRPVICWDDEARQLTIVSHGWVYHARVEESDIQGEKNLKDELLILIEGSSRNAVDADIRTQALELNRRWARIYLGLYPWYLTSGSAVFQPGNVASKTQ